MVGEGASKSRSGSEGLAPRTVEIKASRVKPAQGVVEAEGLSTQKSQLTADGVLKKKEKVMEVVSETEET